MKLEICPETWNQPRPDQGAMRRGSSAGAEIPCALVGALQDVEVTQVHMYRILFHDSTCSVFVVSDDSLDFLC